MRNDLCLCRKCYEEMKPKFFRFKVGKAKATAVYPYEEKVRSTLFQFKGCYDYELKDVFLNYPKPLLRARFRGFTIIPAPSSDAHNAQRGFNHVQEMFSCLGLPMLLALKKVGDVKQTTLDYAQRQSVKERISYVGPKDLSGKKILLVDDVFTTGATIKACQAFIEKRHPKTIQILVMSKTIDPHLGG